MNVRNHKKKKKRKDEKKEDIILDENGIPIGLSQDTIKELAPRLHDEMTKGSSALKIDEVNDEYYNDDELSQDNDFIKGIDDEEDYSNPEIKITTKTNYEIDYIEGFDPSAVDFIRRAKTLEEALEIIEYLEKRKELDPDQVVELRTKLKNHGLESFGSHKKDGHYFQLAGDHRLKEKMKLIKRKDNNSTTKNG